MAQNDMMLTRLQAGFEATPGVAVPATRKLYARCDPANGVSVPLSFFEDATGTYQSRRRPAKGRTSVGFPVTDLATFEDLHWWFYMLVEGTPNESVGTDPSALTHEFLPDLSADSLRSATFEHGLPGNPYEISQGYVRSWTLRFDADSDSELGWMLEMDVVGRTFDPTTFTPAIPDRETEVITARGTKCFVDDDPAAVGTSQLLGQLVSGSITGTINRETDAFAEDEHYVAQGVTHRQAWTVDAQLTLAFLDDTEFAHYRSTDPVQRAIRLLREGSVIAGAERKAFEADLFGYWSAVSTGERRGGKTVTLSLNAGHDITEATDSRFAVTNTQAAIAA